jgi:hypothetical protein
MTRRVLLINWDSYPHVASGGVSTWARGLVENMPDCEFTIFNQLSNPNSNSTLRLPPNVKKVIGMPVFGTTRLEEFFTDGSALIPRIRRTTDSVVVKRFLPLYGAFLESILADTCDPDRLAQLVLELHNFLTVYDSKKCFEHPRTWDVFLERVMKDPLYKEMKLREALHAGALGEAPQGRHHPQLAGLAAVPARGLGEDGERLILPADRARRGV